MNSYYKKQVEDTEKLNGKLAEMISLLTCEKNSTSKTGTKFRVTSELKAILRRLNAKVESLYDALPANAMLIISTGHGDTAIVHRYLYVTT